VTTGISAAPIYKAALFTAASTLWSGETSPVLTTYGMPAFDVYDDVVSFGAVTSQQEPATMGTLRERREILTQEVIFYCFRGGGQEQELVVMARAYELLGDLEQYVRVTDTHLGNPDIFVQGCFLTDHASDAATDQDVLARGRMHVLTATFTAESRITS
jgi:hypothetical protein